MLKNFDPIFQFSLRSRVTSIEISKLSLNAHKMGLQGVQG